MQALCGLQVLFLLFNCQTSGKKQLLFTGLPVNNNKNLQLFIAFPDFL